MILDAAMKIDLPYLKEDTDRNGNMRLYVRVKGHKIRIRATPETPEFLAAYQSAVKELRGSEAPKKKPQPLAKGTFEWLGETYFKASPLFRKLDPASKATRKNILRSCFAEPKKPGETTRIGDCPLAALTPQHIQVLRDRKIDAPGAANNRLKYLSALFAWAVEANLMKHNPVRDVMRAKYASDGFHTWSPDEVDQYIERHPIGTKAYLALALLLYIGARGCDMVTFGRQHVKNGEITFRPSKTKKTTGKVLILPVLPALQAALDAGPTGELTFLVTTYGKPFTAAGFRNWFRDRCDEAKLPHCTGHGLRKAGATIAAENGATEAQLMSIYGWETAKEAARYIKAARQRKMAAGAMGLILSIAEENED